MYPYFADNDGEETLFISFIVDANGSKLSKRVLWRVDEIVDSEALKVIYKMPKWKPAKCQGNAVPIWLIVPYCLSMEQEPILAFSQLT